MIFNLWKKYYKVTTKFALFPVRIENNLVWLQRYFIVYKYKPCGQYSGWYAYSYINRKDAEAQVLINKSGFLGQKNEKIRYER